MMANMFGRLHRLFRRSSRSGVRGEEASVLVCDVFGFVPIEEIKQGSPGLGFDFRDLVMQTMLRHGGRIGVLAGDCVVGIFGGERGAVAAVACAIDALREQRERAAEVGVSLRVGIATGFVIDGTFNSGSGGIDVTSGWAFRMAGELVNREMGVGGEIRICPVTAVRCEGKYHLRGLEEEAKAFEVDWRR